MRMMKGMKMRVSRMDKMRSSTIKALQSKSSEMSVFGGTSIQRQSVVNRFALSALSRVLAGLAPFWTQGQSAHRTSTVILNTNDFTYPRRPNCFESTTIVPTSPPRSRPPRNTTDEAALATEMQEDKDSGDGAYAVFCHNEEAEADRWL